MVNFTAWTKYCQEAMANSEFKTHLISFLERNVKVTDTTNQAKWTFSADDKKKYQESLKFLEFKFNKTNITIKLTDWEQMRKTKNQVREEWHINRQRQLHDYLFEKLGQPFKGTAHQKALETISENDRFEWFERFYKEYGNDVGSKGIFDGLFGLFQYQLNNKRRVVEWHMYEYRMTQMDESKMDEFLNAMRGCLGLEYILTKSEKEDPVLVWLIDDVVLNNRFLKKCLKLKKDGKVFIDKSSYSVTDIPRQCENIVSKWFYGLLSLIHQHLKI